MNTRIAVLAVAALLLVAPLAIAATPPAVDLAAYLNQPMLSPASHCAAGTADAKAPAGTPARITLAAYNTCGSCSTSECNGALLGQMCGLNNGQGWGNCQPPLGNNCSDGITWQCQCWSGPLP